MATASLQHRCFNHGARLAVARCGGCGRPFCRECVTEHEGRMICSVCLRQEVGRRRDIRRWFHGAGAVVRTVVAFFVAWLFFHWAGLAMLEIPTPLHEGTVWDETWWEEETP